LIFWPAFFILFCERIEKVLLGINILLILKYALCVAIMVGIILAPAWLARVNGKGKYDMLLVRISSWLFGWTGIGWLYALFLSVRK
jgi:hypothetical protein